VGKNNFDILHTNFVMPGAFARAIAYKKIPIIITTHHELFGSMSMHWRLILKFTQKFCDSAVYISDQVYGSFSDIKGFAKKDIVIKNGVDVKNLRNLALNEKGQMLLIEAMPAILKQYPNAQLFLLGEGPDEWLLKQKSNLLRVSDSVFFLGWVAKKETMYHIANSDLMIVPSDGTQEGFGLVVAEAMALGTPLICSDIPVFKEVSGNTVSYFPVGDYQELSKVIISSLINKELTKEMTVDAFSRVNASFDQRVMVSKYINLYNDLINEGIEAK
jgi:glycosyltransferase involved in cell wall biosynthesis